MLKKKLAIEYWTGIDFTTLDSYEFARYTLYLIGFARIEITLDFDALRKAMDDAKANQLLVLPDKLEEIDDDIRNGLPFSLPLKDHTQIRAVAIALRQIFKFDPCLK